MADDNESSPPSSAEMAQAEGADPPDLEEARGWNGWRIDDIGGAAIGKVEGVFVDSKSGEPVWLCLRLGRFGHRTAIPYEHVVAAAKRAWAPYDRETIRLAPRVEPDHEIGRELELELVEHFGLPAGGGRAAQLEGREGTTARPA